MDFVDDFWRWFQSVFHQWMMNDDWLRWRAVFFWMGELREMEMAWWIESANQFFLDFWCFRWSLGAFRESFSSSGGFPLTIGVALGPPKVLSHAGVVLNYSTMVTAHDERAFWRQKEWGRWRGYAWQMTDFIRISWVYWWYYGISRVFNGRRTWWWQGI